MHHTVLDAKAHTRVRGRQLLVANYLMSALPIGKVLLWCIDDHLEGATRLVGLESALDTARGYACRVPHSNCAHLY